MPYSCLSTGEQPSRQRSGGLDNLLIPGLISLPPAMAYHGMLQKHPHLRNIEAIERTHQSVPKVEPEKGHNSKRGDEIKKKHVRSSGWRWCGGMEALCVWRPIALKELSALMNPQQNGYFWPRNEIKKRKRRRHGCVQCAEWAWIKAA